MKIINWLNTICKSKFLLSILCVLILNFPILGFLNINFKNLFFVDGLSVNFSLNSAYSANATGGKSNNDDDDHDDDDDHGGSSNGNPNSPVCTNGKPQCPAGTVPQCMGSDAMNIPACFNNGDRAKCCDTKGKCTSERIVCVTSSDGTSGKPQCNDGKDNDGDGAIDFPADFGCSNANENNENSRKAQCQDRKDNDRDRLIDFPRDPGCHSNQDNDERNTTSSSSSSSSGGMTSSGGSSSGSNTSSSGASSSGSNTSSSGGTTSSSSGGSSSGLVIDTTSSGCAVNQRFCNNTCIVGNCCTTLQCNSGQTCQLNNCSCPFGQVLCNGVCVTGNCCVNTQCLSGQACQSNFCTTTSSTSSSGCGINQISCNNACIAGSCCTTSQCNFGQTCQSNNCSCPFGQVLCNGICVTGNCCVNAQCLTGQTCQSNFCTATSSSTSSGGLGTDGTSSSGGTSNSTSSGDLGTDAASLTIDVISTPKLPDVIQIPLLQDEFVGKIGFAYKGSNPSFEIRPTTTLISSIQSIDLIDRARVLFPNIPFTLSTIPGSQDILILGLTLPDNLATGGASFIVHLANNNSLTGLIDILDFINVETVRSIETNKTIGEPSILRLKSHNKSLHKIKVHLRGNDFVGRKISFRQDDGSIRFPQNQHGDPNTSITVYPSSLNLQVIKRSVSINRKVMNIILRLPQEITETKSVVLVIATPRGIVSKESVIKPRVKRH